MGALKWRQTYGSFVGSGSILKILLFHRHIPVIQQTIAIALDQNIAAADITM